MTVRLVSGTSPLRVVLDTTLRIPATAQILGDAAPTLVITTDRSQAERRDELRERGVAVHVVDAEPPWGVDLAAALAVLREAGIRSLLVEGGAAVITSFLRKHLADRVVVGIAPTILGAGTDAVGDLNAGRVSDGLRVNGRSVHLLGDDVVMAGDIS
jgi:riboflavin-specific deaminase-like protein